MEPAGTPPAAMEGLSDRQREIMAKQHQAAKEARARDQDKLLEVISGKLKKLTTQLLHVTSSQLSTRKAPGC